MSDFGLFTHYYTYYTTACKYLNFKSFEINHFWALGLVTEHVMAKQRL